MSRRMPSYDTIIELPYVLDDKGYTFRDININNYDEIKVFMTSKDPNEGSSDNININEIFAKNQTGIFYETHADKYMYLSLDFNNKEEWIITYISIGIENKNVYKLIKVIGVKY